MLMLMLIVLQYSGDLREHQLIAVPASGILPSVVTVIRTPTWSVWLAVLQIGKKIDFDPIWT